jgi:hypothetical protein
MSSPYTRSHHVFLLCCTIVTCPRTALKCLPQQEGTKAWVAHPRAARVNGIIHFLGGAFAGAAPQLLYNGFIELLADAGYTTIATPYAGEIDHVSRVCFDLSLLVYGTFFAWDAMHAWCEALGDPCCCPFCTHPACKTLCIL